jgi:hypothetical protein
MGCCQKTIFIFLGTKTVGLLLVSPMMGYKDGRSWSYLLPRNSLEIRTPVHAGMSILSRTYHSGPQSTPFQLYGFMDHPAFLFYWIDVEICSQNSLNFTYCRSKKPTILMYRLTFIIF